MSGVLGIILSSFASKGIELQFVTSVTGASSLTIPGSGVQAGDIAILCTSAHGLSIAKVWDSAFTEVREDHDVDDSRMVSGYKIIDAVDLDGAEGNGRIITGMNDTEEHIMLLVFRPSKPITSTNISIVDINGEATISNPTAQVLDLGSYTDSRIGVSFMSSTNLISPRIISPAGSMTEVAGDTTRFYGHYVVYNKGQAGTQSTISVDMDDEGDNVMQSWILTVADPSAVAAPSQLVFTSSTTWTVPSGVTSISAVCVGGGGASGASGGSVGGQGGAGGGLAYGTFAVTPGESLDIVVGAGGVGTSGTGGSGGNTTISRAGTVLLSGGGGAGGQNSTIQAYSTGGTSTGTERDGGGVGGGGGYGGSNTSGGAGGGAAGYSGNGGNGKYSNNGNGGSAGAGGGGGGGGADNTGTGGGGGVGLLGEGTSGALGTLALGGGGGSGGTDGASDASGGTGGLYGGGGGAEEDDTTRNGANGGQGAVRIIWGAGRSYPSTNTGDV